MTGEKEYMKWLFYNKFESLNLNLFSNKAIDLAFALSSSLNILNDVSEKWILSCSARLL